MGNINIISAERCDIMKTKIESVSVIHYESKVREVKDDYVIVYYKSGIERVYDLKEYESLPLTVRTFIEINQANKSVDKIDTEVVYSMCIEYREKVNNSGSDDETSPEQSENEIIETAETTEICPECEAEVEVKSGTYRAECPVCRRKLMFCSVCRTASAGDCDYDTATDTCRFDSS